MSVFHARRHAPLSSLHCCLCLCCCVVLHMSCAHAENVTCGTRDITPQDKKKAEISIFNKENDKNNDK